MTPQFLLLQIELNHDVEHTKKTSNLISKLSYLKVALDSMACVISAILFIMKKSKWDIFGNFQPL